MKTLPLDFATNMFGKLKPEIRKRLESVIDNPCAQTWEDAYSVILNGNGKMISLWEAVCKVDWMFPRSAPSFDTNMFTVDEKWKVVPSRETIIEAVKLAVFSNRSKVESN